MAVYDYLCRDCGPFTDTRPMAQCDEPVECPQCRTPSPRAFLNAPRLACMPTGRRLALATNERSSHAPKTLGEYRATHGAGCTCCRAKPGRTVRQAENGAKSFPSARPWMISH
jgi:putative FmdB family regulatory protein